ncbi:MAG: hypothetical protein ACOCV2_02300 [Persicimonas sp.]
MSPTGSTSAQEAKSETDDDVAELCEQWRSTESATCETSAGDPGYCLSAEAVCRAASDALAADRLDEALDAADQAQRNADRTSGALDTMEVRLDEAEERNGELRALADRYRIATWMLGAVAAATTTYIAVDKIASD